MRIHCVARVMQYGCAVSSAPRQVFPPLWGMVWWAKADPETAGLSLH